MKTTNYNGKSKKLLIGAAAIIALLILYEVASIYFKFKAKSLLNNEIITYEAPAVSIEARAADKSSDANPFAGRYVTYEGITRIETKGTTFLVNPEDNDKDVYMEFVVSEGGNDLYSSELVPSGTGIDVDFTDFLSNGEHDLVITMNPYLCSDGEFFKCPVNNAQNVKVIM